VRGQVVALDVGGTFTKGAVVDHAGNVLRVERAPTGVERGIDAVVGTMGDLALKLAAGHDAVAVGIAVPGLVDDEAGIARYAANLGWQDLPLRDLLQERTGLPVALSHDVRTGGIAEGMVGAARGYDDFLFLPIGTGIAGAIVLNGRAYAGSRGMGGEIGHTPVVVFGEQCACGQLGCLETYASAASVARRYTAASGQPVGGAQDVLARGRAGDAVAQRIWGEAVSALATAIASYTLLLDPQLVVIGGGLGEAGDALLEPLRAELPQRLAFRDPPPLVRAALGDQAGTLGAAILGWRAAGDDTVGTEWEKR
jgi:glucokinase